MGNYFSLLSIFSSPTETNQRNARINSTKSKKRRRRRQKRHHLLNQFFLGSKHFLSNTQPNTCLFNEHYYLNSRRELSNPIQLQVSLPETSHSTIIHPIQCTIAIRRDSIKLIHCHDEYYSIDFTFDADRPIQIHIYVMAHELYTSNNRSLSYICCEKTNLDTFKRSYAFNRSAGHGQIFSSMPNDICFPLTVLNETHHNCTIKSRIYPIVIVCREVNSETINSSTTVTEHPTFDQFHIVLATVKLLRLNDMTTSPITPDRVSIVLLNQKHIYNGIVFKLFELYGIENHPSKFSTNTSNDRHNKSIVKILPTSISNEHQPFLNHTNEINVLRRASSDFDLVLNQTNESTCVICLTDMRNVLLLPCRHFCLCSSCAESLKFQSANCPICRVPFRALLQMNAVFCRKNIFINNQFINDDDDDDDEDELIYENISLIDALNLATTTTRKQINKNNFNAKQSITTNDIKYFCSEHIV